MWAYVGAGLAAVAIGFGSGWQVRSWKAGADQTAELEQQARDAMRRAEHVDAAAVTYETKRATGQARDRVITRTVERIVREPFYAPGAAACLDPDGMRILAAAVEASALASEPAPALPAASAVAR